MLAYPSQNLRRRTPDLPIATVLTRPRVRPSRTRDDTPPRTA